MLTPVLVLFLVAALAPMAHRALGKRAGVVLARRAEFLAAVRSGGPGRPEARDPGPPE